MTATAYGLQVKRSLKRTGGRGRRRGDRSRADRIVIQYLAKLSVKYQVTPEKLFRSLLYAWNHENSVCGSLKLRCRKRTRSHAIFLITRHEKVVAQFPISNQVLEDSNIPKYITSMMEPMVEVRPKKLMIKDLRVGMKKVKVRARVLEVSTPRMVFTRFGRQVYAANALIADKTGTIQLSLWGQQINIVSVGAVVEVENSHVTRFMRTPQLRVGRYGKLSVVKDASFPSIQTLRKVYSK
ncbi:MAG: hypothetical protein ACTSUS_01845 [Candidatus Freyarchaeota archaeon]